MLSYFQRFLSLKFFFSYFIVILVAIIVLTTATNFVVPNAFERHMAAMAALMGESVSGLETDLFQNFNNAVNEALLWAAAAAFLAAIAVSYFVSRQIVAPIRQMMTASKYIAEGHYSERVAVRGEADGNLDELAQLAISFNRMTIKLEQAEALRNQLIGDIAHELRTPLTTIKGSMEGLIDGVLPINDVTFQQVHQEADRLQRLVNDLLELNRVESDAFQLNLKPISIHQIIESTCYRLLMQFEEKGVTLKNNIAEDLPAVLGDEDRIGQVLLNLIGNGLQYTPVGGTVEISAKPTESELLVSITDTGIGLTAEHLPHIFTRFYRVDKSRSRVGGGSGIGLTIAKQLVEAHGGQIWAESQGAGNGSVFTFSIPLAALQNMTTGS
jgi:histidine kinase